MEGVNGGIESRRKKGRTPFPDISAPIPAQDCHSAHTLQNRKEGKKKGNQELGLACVDSHAVGGTDKQRHQIYSSMYRIWL